MTKTEPIKGDESVLVSGSHPEFMPWQRPTETPPVHSFFPKLIFENAIISLETLTQIGLTNTFDRIFSAGVSKEETEEALLVEENMSPNNEWVDPSQVNLLSTTFYNFTGDSCTDF